MIPACGFCQKELEIVNHTNSDRLDIYLCEGCLRPDFDTRYRIVTYKGFPEPLANTIRLNDYFIVINYAFSFIDKRSNYTKIYKKVIGEFNDSLDLEPITLGRDKPVCDLDLTLRLPLSNPSLALQKLQIYTTFS
jgi:hypothetical protein